LKNLLHLNKYFWKYRGRFIGGFLFIIASNLFAVYSPQIIREAFDLVKVSIEKYNNFSDPTIKTSLSPALQKCFELLGYDANQFSRVNSMQELTEVLLLLVTFLSILYIVFALLKGLFLFYTRQTIIVMSRFIEFDLKNEIYNHYQKLDLSFYKQNNTGDLMNRISEDVGRVRMYLGPAVMYTLNLIVLFVMSIVAMVNVNKDLTLYVLAPLPIMAIIIYKVSSIINARSDKTQKQQSKLTTLAQEAFSGIRVLKAFNKEKINIHQFETECNQYKATQLDLVKIDALFMPIILLLIGLSTILTVYLGGIKAINGEITVGNIAEFVIYVNMLTWPFATVGWVTSLVQQAASSQKRINEFLNTQPAIFNVKTNEEANKINGTIEFKNVSFTYSHSGIKALKNVSFKIGNGNTLAIVGKTGSGKSTIANLLLRMYEPNDGTILIDNEAIENLGLFRLRKNIGYVPQDVFLFSDTIFENIAFGLNEQQSNKHKIEKAAKDADIYNNILSFNNQFETILGERGITLSGGQKQRVSIARAIVKDPSILIFDDCLSAVDTHTEDVILNNLKKVMHNKTTILISHRISTVKHADKIIVLENGIITESGSHAELLANKKYYFEMYQKQLLEEKSMKFN
jgi:ATP-binding cassette, subfamily B, multidrug efflux pump